MRKVFLMSVMFLLTLVGVVMIKGRIFTALLAFELIWLIVLLACRISIGKTIQVKWRLWNRVVQKKDEVPIAFEMFNQSFLPVSKATVILSYENLYSGVSGEIVREGAVPARSSSVFGFLEQTEHAGLTRYEISDCIVYDLLQVFSCRIAFDERSEVIVLPDCLPVGLLVTEQTKYYEDDEECSPDLKGDDVSEIVKIREFQNGDAMQKIHWKLSAKEDKWMVREFGMPAACPVRIYLDLFPRHMNNHALERMDAYWDILFSIVHALFEQKCVHHVVWFSERRQQMQRIQISTEDDIYEMLVRVLRSGPCQQEYNLEEIYRSRYPEGACAVTLLLDTNLKLWKDYEEFWQFSVLKYKKEMAELCLEV